MNRLDEIGLMNVGKRRVGSPETDGGETAVKRARLGDPSIPGSGALQGFPLHIPAALQLGRRILVVGEGDFSLSNSLVQREADASHVTATTVRRATDTHTLFPRATESIMNLVSRGATVLHGVDACALRGSDGIRDNYDLIVFTFPFADSHNGPQDPRHARLVS